MRFQWTANQRVPIVILDGSNQTTTTLLPLFGEHPHTALEAHQVFDQITPMQMIWAAWYFLRCASLRCAVTAARLRCMRPKIVVTFIDNSLLFQRVAKLLQHRIRFLAIQNGVRMLSRDNTKGTPRIFHAEFACLGQWDVDAYKRQGAEVKHYYPVGSLKDACYRENTPQPPSIKHFDLCLISQIKKQHYQTYPKTMQSLELLASHLRRFCETHQTTICVAARRHPNGRKDLFDWEISWFREHLGHHAEIIPNDIAAFTSYALVDASRVSLALHTTLLYEGFGRGNRILSCNYTGDVRYDFPIPGPWRLCDPSYEAFEKGLLGLLHMPDIEYVQRAGQWPHYLIGYVAQQPTHRFLQQLIADAVAGAPAPF